MNSHERVLEAVRNFRQPVTGPIIQAELSPKLSYALVLSCLNDLVRNGKLAEGSNEVGKRTFKVSEPRNTILFSEFDAGMLNDLKKWEGR